MNGGLYRRKLVNHWMLTHEYDPEPVLGLSTGELLDLHRIHHSQRRWLHCVSDVFTIHRDLLLDVCPCWKQWKVTGELMDCVLPIGHDDLHRTPKGVCWSWSSEDLEPRYFTDNLDQELD